MALGERMRRLDDQVLGKPGLWSRIPRWLWWLRLVAVAVGLLSMVFLDQPWSTAVLVVLVGVVWSLTLRHRVVDRRDAGTE